MRRREGKGGIKHHRTRKYQRLKREQQEGDSKEKEGEGGNENIL